MKFALFVLLSLTFVALASEDAGPFSLQVTTLQKSIPIGIAPVIIFKVENKGPSDLRYLESPSIDGLSVKLSCDDARIKKPKTPKFSTFSAINESMSYSTIGNQTYQHFWRSPTEPFSAPGVFKLTYEAKMFYYKMEESVQLTQSWIGEIDIEVLDEKISRLYANDLMKFRNGTSRRLVELLKVLSSIDDSFIAPSILEIGRRDPRAMFPACKALRKFIGDEIGRSSLEKLAAEFPEDMLFKVDNGFVSMNKEYGYNYLSACLSTFEAVRVFPSANFIKAQLKSRSKSRAQRTLEYILSSDAQKLVATKDIIPFLTEDDEHTRELAQKILEKKPDEKNGLDF